MVNLLLFVGTALTASGFLFGGEVWSGLGKALGAVTWIAAGLIWFFSREETEQHS